MAKLMTKFEREKHVYKSDAFEEIIKDTIRFFNGTPVHTLPPPERFHGTGVYAIYYIGKSKYYKNLFDLNRLEFSQPIYVGKAVPIGWRQSRNINEGSISHELFGRLREHSKSIEQTSNLILGDFYCRFMILENSESSLISTVEAGLVRHYKPIWNTYIDGFGNHDPGSGRYNQAKSEWDILHSGRPWADKCKGESASLKTIELKAKQFFKKTTNK
jgi:hypothetical protein